MKACVLVFSFLLNLIFCCTAFGGTLITAPIDSRPVSNEYLNDLADMAGDEFYTVDDELLDHFPEGESGSFADSQKVMEQIRRLVEKNNKTDTTVIINTSSYFTGGLVGSRVEGNYEYNIAAANELFSLVKSCTAPQYYICLTMPRNLPESRNNEYWNDNEKVRALGHFYMKHNSDTPFKNEIENGFENVEPSQLLMEWSYVKNKEAELGNGSLTPWEKEFLAYADNNEEFRPWFEKYETPFMKTADMFSSFVKWQKRGYIDEIVVSSDDLQLPHFISFLYENGAGDFVPLENGSPIKFSFARTYTTSGENSIYKKIQSEYGIKQAYLAVEGKGKNVNFIFGMDEIPQMVYARDVSKRHGKTTGFLKECFGTGTSVNEYDVLNSEKLLSNAINFVNGADAKTKKSFYMFLYDYSGKTNEHMKAVNSMSQKAKYGNVGLIEIYDNNTLIKGKHEVFEQLWNGKNDLGQLDIAHIQSYSSWNTAANAIGLGVAHAQIYGIMEEDTKEPEKLLKAHVSSLGRHVLEDGVYNFSIKRSLGASGYKVKPEDTFFSETVSALLNHEELLKKFVGLEISCENGTAVVKNCWLENVSMPWKRLFECYINIEVEVEKVL